MVMLPPAAALMVLTVVSIGLTLPIVVVAARLSVVAVIFAAPGEVPIELPMMVTLPTLVVNAAPRFTAPV